MNTTANLRSVQWWVAVVALVVGLLAVGVSVDHPEWFAGQHANAGLFWPQPGQTS